MSDANCFQDQDGNLLRQEPKDYEFRIYADDMAQTWAVVDEIDYHWAIQWRWHINKPHPRRTGSKQYLCRSNGSGGRKRGPRLFLHVEIMKRTGIPQPDPDHALVGHDDDDEFNCRRENLLWLTPRKNRAASVKTNKLWSDLQRRRNDRKSQKNVPAC